MKRRDALHEELKKGGTEAPCPFCNLPRVQRSDYIRCVVCGTNWMEGEALDKDPRSERLRRMIDDSAAANTNSPKKSAYGERNNGPDQRRA